MRCAALWGVSSEVGMEVPTLTHDVQGGSSGRVVRAMYRYTVLRCSNFWASQV
jgi:hypothetical protein